MILVIFFHHPQNYDVIISIVVLYILTLKYILLCELFY